MWIDNAKAVATKATSMWCMYGATITGSIAVIQASANADSTAFQVLTVILTVCGALNRLVAQPGLNTYDNAKQCVESLKD